MNRQSSKRLRRTLRVEELDQRLLLARDSVYISEFLANNASVLADEDGEYSDWIELHNPTSESVDLSGWSLTDSPDQPAKWIFPKVTIPPNGFQIVFASDKDRRDPSGELHTNFKLTTDGEYLALIKPDQTIAHEFSPAYPVQTFDISYGFASAEIPLIRADSLRSFHIPSANDVSQETAWRDITFDDRSWRRTRGAIGYDIDPRLDNAGFERTGLSPWRTRGPVSMVDASFGVAPTEGQRMALATTRESMATRAGAEFFLDLPRSALEEVNVGRVERVAALKREVVAREGAVLTLDWSFLTSDRRDGDFAFAVVSDSSSIVLLADPTSNLVASSSAGYSQETGFRQFTHTFTTAGSYTIAVGVAQAIDLDHDSALIVDNLRLDDLGDLGGSGPSYGPVFQADIANEGSGNNSVWWRQEFQSDSVQEIQGALLRVRYDDGFAAFINGQPVASRNAPVSLMWNSAATDVHPNAEAIEFEETLIPSSMLRTGTNVLAIQGLNGASDIGDFLLDAELSGISKPGREPGFLSRPTPGGPNLSPSLNYGHTADVTFDHARGFYTGSFRLVMSVKTPGATIRYTTDGSEPTERTGQVYVGPIRVASSTVVRAAAFKEGLIPRRTTTASYLFIEDVLRQSTETAVAAGFPPTWPDYEMDPDVIGSNGQDLFSGKYARTIRDALVSLPTVSLVMDRDYLFGDQGLFRHPDSYGDEWERPTSVEWIQPDRNVGFQIDAGLRIQGGVSRIKTDKLSMRLSFRERYGASNLRYPLFGADGPVEFNGVVLRSSSGEAFLGFHYIRDETLRRIEKHSGNPSALGSFVHVYINGLYWGVYDLTERIDAPFVVTREGGTKEDYDIYDAGDRSNTMTTPIQGTMDAWTRLISLSSEVGMAADETARTAAIMRLQGRNPDGSDNPTLESYLDFDNFINYLVINLYAGNVDWPGHNYYMYRRRGPESEGFKFLVWDAEWTFDLGDMSLRVNDLDRGPAAILNPLLKSEAFRVRFADRVHKLFSPGGALYVNPSSPNWDPVQPDNNMPARVYAEVAHSVRSAIVAESARWGDMRGQSNPPFTRDEDWTTIVNKNLAQFFPRRSAMLLDQLRSDDLYRDAPTFSLLPGRVTAGSTLTLAPKFGAAIYYTTDGSDPRLADGSVSASAMRYTGPIPIQQRTQIRARTLAGNKWSAIEEGTYLVDESPPTSVNLRISEINFNPHDPLPQFGETAVDNNQFEFIELANIGSEAIDLTGVKLVSRFGHGVDFEFGRQSLAAGQHVVVARDRAAFATRYGTSINLAVGAAGDESNWGFSADLANDGDSLLLVDSTGRTIQTLSFGDSDPWPSRADGNGSSLELIDGAMDPDDSQSWRASGEFGGSPGSAGLGPASRIVFNEVLANPRDNGSDFLELFNNTNEPVNIQGWYVSDSQRDYFRFQVAQPTIIPPGGYRVFTDDELGFGLSASQGEELFLIEAAANGKPVRFVDWLEFGPTSTGISLGRWPNGEGSLYPLNGPSPGAANPETAVIDAEEVDRLCQAIHGGSYDPAHDWDGDRQLTDWDLNYLLESIVQTGPGDANLDRRFTTADLVLIFVAAEYEDGIAGNSTWSEGDWNCDGQFDTSDLVLAFQRASFQLDENR
jgi:hypothetical protein